VIIVELVTARTTSISPAVGISYARCARKCRSAGPASLAARYFGSPLTGTLVWARKALSSQNGIQERTLATAIPSSCFGRERVAIAQRQTNTSERRTLGEERLVTLLVLSLPAPRERLSLDA
jgi:hypothetical protein